MSESKKYRPRKPAGLDGSGLKFWNKVIEDFDLDHHEVELLAQLCKTLNRIDELDKIADREGLIIESPHGKKAHPAAVESRQMRMVFNQLAKTLRFPGVDV